MSFQQALHLFEITMRPIALVQARAPKVRLDDPARVGENIHRGMAAHRKGGSALERLGGKEQYHWILQKPTELECDYGTELPRQRIAERVREREHQGSQASKRTGISFVGPRRVPRRAPTKRGCRYEVFGSLNTTLRRPGVERRRSKPSNDCPCSTRSTTRPCSSPRAPGGLACVVAPGAARHPRFMRQDTCVEANARQQSWP
jgi:hypothetical protein